MLKTLLEHPLTRGLPLDAPETTRLRREIILSKPFLRRIYQEWYAFLSDALPAGLSGPVLELGSGGGFLEQVIPGLITSDILPVAGLDLALDGRRLPFAAAALRGIVFTNVFHHIPQPAAFLAEAARCIQPGGVVAMVEPWASPWSEWVYTRLHDEPFDPRAAAWEFPERGPLSGSNQALPWIVFERDRARFTAEFPAWKIRQMTPCLPFRYLLSGGVSLRSLAPGWTFPAWRRVERLLQPWVGRLGMFAQIVLEKVNP